MQNKQLEINLSPKFKQNFIYGIFFLTILCNAFLLFWIQPLVAKMILPYFGGAPAVWNTTMMFFQFLLLLGYFFAFITTKFLSISRQAILQIAILLIATIMLPIVFYAYNDTDINPIRGLILLFLTSIALPSFALCANAPMLQRWFSDTLHPHAKDPYFLYSASNLGSMLALILFPFILEVHLTIHQQNILWTVFFIFTILLITMSFISVKLSRHIKAIYHPPAEPQIKIKKETFTPISVTAQQRLLWLLLSFAPSSLLLGVTTYITTDIASVPLFWVIPLALFLASYIITFARKPIFPHKFNVIVQFCLLFPFIFVYSFPYSIGSIWISYNIHLLTFFFTSLVCIGELVKRRPSHEYLTEFYLWIALGGLLGGIFNALIAPVIFTNVYEYPIAMAIACMLRPVMSKNPPVKLFNWLDAVFPFFIVLLVYFFAWLYMSKTPSVIPSTLVLLFTLLSIVVFAFPERPIRFGLGVGALLISAMLFINPYASQIIATQRNFFGVLRIIQDNNTHILMHGTTIHGAEIFSSNKMNYTNDDPAHLQLCNSQTAQVGLNQNNLNELFNRSAITYYAPIQDVYTVIQKNNPQLNIAIAGLGTGTMACFARKSDSTTFYEIDPLIIKTAENRNYFTYISDCPPKQIILGDARLKLAKSPNNSYDIIVVDAFSSDAIPIHLITKQAIEMYLNKLKPNGILAFNISNRHLDLSTVLSAISEELNLTSLIRIDTDSDWSNYKFASVWVVMAKNPQAVADIANMPGWNPLPISQNHDLWTDNYSDIISTLK